MLLTNSLEIKSYPVVFFDSGVGGLSYLARAKEKLPDERFVYIADTKNYPYGDKSSQEIREAVLGVITRVFQKINMKCMVIACNTASVVALDDLRKRFSLPFIGVVPAIKPAAAYSEKKKIAVLATLRTVKDQYLHHLIADFAGGCDVTVVPAGDIRDIVEKRYFTATIEEKEALLKETVKKLKNRDIDAVVLGCTHFLFLEKEFKEILGNTISVIDSREGVINQLIHILQKQDIAAQSLSGSNECYITGNNDSTARYTRFCKEFGLSFSGII
ncbi:MAG: glutamate racemase [Spirochaetales bacterium]|nr:glutamate racemase [Spirochaetales bacterium]